MNNTLADELFDSFKSVFQEKANPKELGGIDECYDRENWFQTHEVVAKELYQYVSKKDEAEEFDTNEIRQTFRRKTIGAYTNALAKKITDDLNIIVVNGVCYFYNFNKWIPILDWNTLALILGRYWYDNENILFELSDMEYEKILKSLLASPYIQSPRVKFEKEKRLIFLEDGAYNIDIDTIIELSPKYYNLSNISVTTEEIYKAENYSHFDAYLKTLSGGNYLVEQLILEVMGVLLSNYMPKNFFLLYGESNTGKSTFASFIAELIGLDYCYTVSDVDQLANDKWAMGALAGKKLLLSLDLPDATITSKGISILKQLTGDADFINGQKKHQDPVRIKNTAKILFATNHSFRIRGTDKGLLNRAVVIPLLNPVPFKAQNDNLVDNLLQEKGYIFAKCMDGLCRWRSNNKQFTAREEFLRYAMPTLDSPMVNIQITQKKLVADFINDCCLLLNNSWSSTADLYLAFEGHCHRAYSKPCDKASFGRYLAQIQGVSSKKQSDVRGFTGIAIKGGDSDE